MFLAEYEKRGMGESIQSEFESDKYRDGGLTSVVGRVVLSWLVATAIIRKSC